MISLQHWIARHWDDSDSQDQFIHSWSSRVPSEFWLMIIKMINDSSQANEGDKEKQ